MKILFLVGRELAYPRNDVVLRAFKRFAQVDVLGVERRPASLVLNSVRIAVRALPRLITGGYDLIFVGFYGHLLIWPARLFGRAPLLFDAFVSTYDTLIEDRQVASRRSLTARLAWWIDRSACRMAQRVLLDTEAHADYFAREFGLDRGRFTAIPVGCNEEIFYPQAKKTTAGPVNVTYYTSYLPLHGVDVVVRAAARLRHAPVRFRIIGAGQTFAAVKKLAQDLAVENIEFLPEMPLAQIAAEVANADICLGGHFGATAKAGRVVPGKIYQILAMQTALIASDTEANLQLLQSTDAAWLCPPNDPEKLAQAVETLAGDPALRRRVAANGRALYEEKCSEAAITRMLQDAVMALVKTR